VEASGIQSSAHQPAAAIRSTPLRCYRPRCFPGARARGCHLSSPCALRRHRPPCCCSSAFRFHLSFPPLLLHPNSTCRPSPLPSTTLSLLLHYSCRTQSHQSRTNPPKWRRLQHPEVRGAACGVAVAHHGLRRGWGTASWVPAAAQGARRGTKAAKQHHLPWDRRGGQCQGGAPVVRIKDWLVYSRIAVRQAASAATPLIPNNFTRSRGNSPRLSLPWSANPKTGARRTGQSQQTGRWKQLQCPNTKGGPGEI